MRTIRFAPLVFALASQANAVTVSSVPGAPDPGPVAPQTVVIDFEGPLPTGYSLSGDYGIVNTTTSAAAQPAPNTDTDFYLYTSSALGTGIATLSTPSLKSIGFYWGSIDTYNFVEILGPGNSVLFATSGSSFPNGGNQVISATNRRVTFSADPGEVIRGIRFRSTGVAFEIDDIAATPIPEPASWAMLILGFGTVGMASRRRRTLVTA
jgi:hypothetical protein